MRFKQWFWEDAQGSADGYGNDVDPQDANLFDPTGKERKPVPQSALANKLFGVKIRPKDKNKKRVPSFVMTS